MDIEKLKKEYSEQDNRGTRYPIYVQVQELKWCGVVDDNYGCNGEVVYETVGDCEDCGGDCDYGREDQLEYEVGDAHCTKEKQYVLYRWEPIEFFLTIKGAEDFIAREKHNCGKLRTWVDCFSYRNTEMTELMNHMGFKKEKP